MVFATSLRQQVDIFADSLNFFFMPTQENYRAFIKEDKLDRRLGNSLFGDLVSTALTLTLGAMAAYGLARLRFAGPTPSPTPPCCCARCRWRCSPSRCS